MTYCSPDELKSVVSTLIERDADQINQVLILALVNPANCICPPDDRCPDGVAIVSTEGNNTLAVMYVLTRGMEMMMRGDYHSETYEDGPKKRDK
jgi:hypothetical protein